MQNLLFVIGGSQLLAAGKQPVGMLSMAQKRVLSGFEGFVTKRITL
jgi:hypothetical protein